MYVELVIVYRGRCMMCVGTCIVQYMGSLCRGEGGLSEVEGVSGVIHSAYVRK